jgi:hypothetical protein
MQVGIGIGDILQGFRALNPIDNPAAMNDGMYPGIIVFTVKAAVTQPRDIYCSGTRFFF